MIDADECYRLEAKCRQLRRELADARAFQLKLAERIAAASEVLSNLAERKRRAEPVPRPLFEAALRVHRFGTATSTTDCDAVTALREGVWESLRDTAERIIRRAAACGVREEE